MLLRSFLLIILMVLGTACPFLIAGPFHIAVGDIETGVRAEPSESADGNEIALTGNDGKLYVFKSDRVILGSAWPADLGENKIITSPFLIDVDKNGEKEIAFGTFHESGCKLYIFNKNASSVSGTPVNCSFNIGSDLVMDDINNDGSPEWIVPDSDGGIHVLSLNGTEIQLINAAAGEPVFISLADINNDGEKEMLAVSTSGNLSVFQHNTSGTFLLKSGFPVSLSGTVYSSPVFSDKAGIAVGLNNGDVKIVDKDGNILKTILSVESCSVMSSPVIADFDGTVEKIGVISEKNILYIYDIAGNFIEKADAGKAYIENSASGQDWKNDRLSTVMTPEERGQLFFYKKNLGDSFFSSESWGIQKHHSGIKLADSTTPEAKYFSPNGDASKDTVHLGSFDAGKEMTIDQGILYTSFLIYDTNNILVFSKQDKTNNSPGPVTSFIEWNGLAIPEYHNGSNVSFPVKDGIYKYVFKVTSKDGLESQDTRGEIFADTQKPGVDFSVSAPLILDKSKAGLPSETEISVFIEDNFKSMQSVKIEILKKDTSEVVWHTFITSGLELTNDLVSGKYKKDYKVIWNGRDQYGRGVENNLYAVRITAEDSAGNKTEYTKNNNIIFVSTVGTIIDPQTVGCLPFIIDPQDLSKNSTTLHFQLKNHFFELYGSDAVLMNSLDPQIFQFHLKVDVFGKHLKINELDPSQSIEETVSFNLADVSNFSFTNSSCDVATGHNPAILAYNNDKSFNLKWDGKNPGGTNVYPDEYALKITLEDAFSNVFRVNGYCVVADSLPQITGIINNGNGYYKILGRANKLKDFQGYEMYSRKKISGTNYSAWTAIKVPEERQAKNDTLYPDSNKSIRPVTGDNGVLALWDSFGKEDGVYQFRLHLIGDNEDADSVSGDLNFTGTPMVRDLKLSSDTISPNTDGIKDDAEISFSISAPLHNAKLVFTNINTKIVSEMSLGIVTSSSYPSTIVYPFNGTLNSVSLDGNYKIALKSDEVSPSENLSLLIAHDTSGSSGTIILNSPATNEDGSVKSDLGYLYSWYAKGHGIQKPRMEVDWDLDVYGKQNVTEYPKIPIDIWGIERYKKITIANAEAVANVKVKIEWGFIGDQYWPLTSADSPPHKFSGFITKTYDVDTPMASQLTYVPITGIEYPAAGVPADRFSESYCPKVMEHSTYVIQGGVKLDFLKVDDQIIIGNNDDNKENFDFYSLKYKMNGVEFDPTYFNNQNVSYDNYLYNDFYRAAQEVYLVKSHRNGIVRVYFDDLEKTFNNKYSFLLSEHTMEPTVLIGHNFNVSDYFTGANTSYNTLNLRDSGYLQILNQTVQIDAAGRRYVDVSVDFDKISSVPWPLKTSSQFNSVAPYGDYSELSWSQSNQVSLMTYVQKDNIDYFQSSLSNIQGQFFIPHQAYDIVPYIKIKKVRMLDSDGNEIANSSDYPELLNYISAQALIKDPGLGTNKIRDATVSIVSTKELNWTTGNTVIGGLEFISFEKNDKTNNILNNYRIPADVNSLNWDVELQQENSGKFLSIKDVNNSSHLITIERSGSGKDAKEVLNICGVIDIPDFQYYTLTLGRKKTDGSGGYEWWKDQKISVFDDGLKAVTNIGKKLNAYIDITSLIDGDYTLLLTVKGSQVAERTINFHKGVPVQMQNVVLQNTNFDHKEKNLVVNFNLSEDSIRGTYCEGVKLNIRDSIGNLLTTIATDGYAGNNTLNWDGRISSQYVPYGSYNLEIIANNYGGGITAQCQIPFNLINNPTILSSLTVNPDSIIPASSLGKNKTLITFNLSKDMDLSDNQSCLVEIKDSGNNIIRSINALAKKGTNLILWNGYKDNNIDAASPGIYSIDAGIYNSSGLLTSQITQIQVFDSNPGDLSGIININDADRYPQNDPQGVLDNVIPGDSGVFFNWKASAIGQKAPRQDYSAHLAVDGVKYPEIKFTWQVKMKGTKVQYYYPPFPPLGISQNKKYSDHSYSSYHSQEKITLPIYASAGYEMKGTYYVANNSSYDSHSGGGYSVEQPNAYTYILHASAWKSPLGDYDLDYTIYATLKQRQASDHYWYTPAKEATLFYNGTEWLFKDENNRITNQFSFQYICTAPPGGGFTGNMPIIYSTYWLEGGATINDLVITEENTSGLLNVNKVIEDLNPADYSISGNITTANISRSSIQRDITLSNPNISGSVYAFTSQQSNLSQLLGSRMPSEPCFVKTVKVENIDNPNVSVSFKDDTNTYPNTILVNANKNSVRFDSIKTVVSTGVVEAWDSMTDPLLAGTGGYFTGNIVLPYSQKEQTINLFSSVNPEGANKDSEIRIDSLNIDLYKTQGSNQIVVASLKDNVSVQNGGTVQIKNYNNDILIPSHPSKNKLTYPTNSQVSPDSRYENFSLIINKDRERKYLIVKGTAFSPSGHYDGYTLEWGQGASPVVWNLIKKASFPVTSTNELGQMDISGLSGTYSLLLTLKDGNNAKQIKRVFNIGDYIDGLKDIYVIQSPYNVTSMILSKNSFINGDEVYLKKSASDTTAVDEVVYGAYEPGDLPEQVFTGQTYSDQEITQPVMERVIPGDEKGKSTASQEDIRNTFQLYAQPTPRSTHSLDSPVINDHILINELYLGGDVNNPDIPMGEKYSQYIELYNPTSATVDISGWILGDGEGEGKIPPSTSIPAQGYFIIARDADAYFERFGSYPDLEWDPYQYDNFNNPQVPDLLWVNDKKPVISMELDHKGGQLLSIVPKFKDEYLDVSGSDLIQGDYVYDFKPDGLRFNWDLPPTLIYHGSLSELSPDTDVNTLRLAYINDNGAIEFLDSSMVNTTPDGKFTITAEIYHFSQYALVATASKPKTPVLDALPVIVNQDKLDISGTSDILTKIYLYQNKKVIDAFSDALGRFLFAGIVLSNTNRFMVQSENISCQKSDLSPEKVVIQDQISPFLLPSAKIIFSPNNDGILDKISRDFIFSENVLANISVISPDGSDVFNYKGTTFESSHQVVLNSSICLVEGQYTCIVKAVDEANNSMTPELIPVLADMTPPNVINFSQDHTNICFSRFGKTDLLNFEMKYSDNFDNNIIANISISDEYGNIVCLISSTNNQTGVICKYYWDGKDKNGNTVPNGIYQITANVSDHAGNFLNKILSSIKVDSTPPAGTLTINKDIFIPGEFIQYSYSIDKNANTELTVIRSNQIVSIVKTKTWENAGQKTNHFVCRLNEGQYQIQLICSDSAGNSSTLESFFTVDSTPPQIDIAESDINVSGNNVSINGTIFDKNINQIKIDMVGSDQKTYTLMNNSGNNYIRQNILAKNISAEAGVYTIKISASDTAGNVSSATYGPYKLTYTNTFIIVDSYNMNLNISKNIGFYLTQSVVSASVDIYSPDNICLFTTNISDPDSGMHNVLFSPVTNQNGKFKDGVYHYIISASNNGQTEKKIVNINFDSTPPQISITFPEIDTFTKDSFNIIGSITDNNLRSYSGEIYQNGEIVRQKLFSGVQNIENGMLASLMNQSEGQYYLSVKAEDACGNSSSKEIAFTIKNSVPTVQIISPLSGANIKPDFDLVIHIQDFFNTNYGIWTKKDNEDWQLLKTFRNIPGFNTVHISNFIQESTGKYYFTAHSLSSSPDNSVQYIIDAQKPEISLNYKNLGDKIQLLYSVDDLYLKNYKITDKTSGKTLTSGINNTEGILSLIISKDGLDQWESISLIAEDCAGNTAEQTIFPVLITSSIKIISPLSGRKIKNDFNVQAQTSGDYSNLTCQLQLTNEDMSKLLYSGNITEQLMNFNCPCFDCPDGNYSLTIRMLSDTKLISQDTIKLELDSGVGITNIVFTPANKNVTLDDSSGISLQYEALEHLTSQIIVIRKTDKKIINFLYYNRSLFPGHYNDVWDLRDSDRNLVADNVYKIAMNFTDDAGNEKFFTNDFYVGATEKMPDYTPPKTALEFNSSEYFIGPKTNYLILVPSSSIQLSAVDLPGTNDIYVSGVKSTYFSLSNKENVYNSQIIFNDEGNFEFKFHSVDWAKNSEPERKINLIIDDSAPQCKIECPSNGSVFNAKMPVKISINDFSLNDYRVEYTEKAQTNWIQIYNKTSTTNILNSITNAVVTDWTISALAEGEYTLRLIAKDKLRNISTNSTDFIIDHTPPVCQIISPINYTDVSGNDILEISGNIDDSHIKEYSLFFGKGLNPATWDLIKTCSENANNAVLTNINLNNYWGMICIKVMAVDIAGNSSEETIIVKRKPPVVINEINPCSSLTNAGAWLELYSPASKDINIADFKLTTCNGLTNSILADKPLIINKHKLCLVRLNYYENDNTNKENINGNSYLNAYISMNLSPEDDQLLLLVNDLIVDAVIWCNYDNYVSQSNININNKIIECNEWTGSFGTGNESSAVRVNSNGYTSMARLPGKDSNSKSDWRIFTFPTPGLPNDIMPPITTVSVSMPKYKIITNIFISMTNTEQSNSVVNTNYFQTNIIVSPKASISLSAIDDLIEPNDQKGVGVKEILYNFNSNPWSVYSTNIRLSVDGIYEFFYYSIDNNENSENITTRQYQLDSTHPNTYIGCEMPHFATNNNTYISSRTKIALTSVDPVVNKVNCGVAYSEYKINNQSWNIYTTEFNIAGNDGNYSVSYYSADNVSNVEPVNMKEYILDNTPPAVPQRIAELLQGTNVYIYWQTVTNWDLAGYNVYRNNVKINSNLITQIEYKDVKPQFSTHQYTVTSVDRLGNESGKSAPVQVKVCDDIKIISPEMYQIWCDDIRIHADVDLNDARGEWIEVGNGRLPLQWTLIHRDQDRHFHHHPEDITHSWDTDHLNGDYTIRIRTKENNQWVENSVYIFVDNTNPASKLFVNGQQMNAEITNATLGTAVSFDAVDPIVNNVSAGVKYTKCKIRLYGRDQHHGVNKPDDFTIWNGQPIIISQPGYYCIQYFSVDNAERFHDKPYGNVEALNIQWIYIPRPAPADHTPPVITISGVQTGVYYPSSVQPLITVTDNSEVTYSALLNGLPYTGNLLSDDGNYVLSVTAQDASGNTANASISFAIDKTVPQIFITGVENNKFYKTPVAANVLIQDDNLKNQTVVLDGAPYINGSLIRGEKKHNLTARAWDKADNYASSSIDFTIDSTIPMINISGVAEGMTYTEVAPIVSIQDQNLDFAKTLMTLNGKDFSSGTLVTSNANYGLFVHAEDLAGNTVEKNLHFTVYKAVITNTLLFSASFNHDANADIAVGNKQCIDGGEITTGDKGRLPGEALSESGRGAKYSAASNINATNGTVMMWVKPNWSTAGEQGRYLFSVNDPNQGNHNNGFTINRVSDPSVNLKEYMNLVVFGSKGTVLQIKDKNGTLSESVIDNGLETSRWYADNAWTHLAWSWNAKTGIVKLWINGNQAGCFTNNSWTPNGKADLWIGNRHNDESRKSACRIDDAKIFSRELNTEEIKQQSGMIKIGEVFTANSKVELAYIEKKEEYYCDRDYIITNMDSIFRGSLFIKTANDDKQFPASQKYLSLKTEDDIEVVIGFDSRVSVPLWISSNFTPWMENGRQKTIGTTDVGNQKALLFRKQVTKGTSVELKGNGANNDNTYNYFVIIKR